MFKRILVPLQTTAHAARVFPAVTTLAKRDGASVVLLQVGPRSADAAPAGAATLDLDALVSQLRSDGIEATALHEADAPAHGIEAVAEKEHVDLIVLTPEPRHGLEALRHPSVTAQVFESTTKPVFVWPKGYEGATPGTPDDMLRAVGSVVILPLDGSRMAERAMPFAIALANAYHRTLLLLRVVPDQISQPIIVDGFSYAFDAPENNQQAESAYLSSIRQRYTNDVEESVQSMLVTGLPAKKIIEVADAHPGSVVVMSTHGHGGVARMILGSVATDVIAGARAPLLVIAPHVAEPLHRTAPLKPPVARLQ